MSTPRDRARYWLSRGSTSRMSEKDICDKAETLRNQFEPEFGIKKIRVNGLDNPYMSDDARIVLLNAVRASMR